MAVSRLVKLDPFSVTAAIEVGIQAGTISESMFSLEPLGAGTWVTSDGFADTPGEGSPDANLFDSQVLDQIEATIQDGLECGGLPLLPVVRMIMERSVNSRAMAGFSTGPIDILEGPVNIPVSIKDSLPPDNECPFCAHILPGHWPECRYPDYPADKCNWTDD